MNFNSREFQFTKKINLAIQLSLNFICNALTIGGTQPLSNTDQMRQESLTAF